MSAAAVPDDEGDAAWDVSGDVNWDDWTDAEGVTALEPCVDLLAPDTHAGHASPQAALEAARAGGIDVLGIARQHGCDQYGCIRLVNYLRKKVSHACKCFECMNGWCGDVCVRTRIAPALPRPDHV